MKNQETMTTESTINNLTPNALREMVANSTANPNVKDFAIHMQDQSWLDVIHDIKQQTPFFEMTKEMNAGYPVEKLAKLFYDKLSKDYEEVYGNHGGHCFTAMLAIGMQNEVSDYFSTITYRQITRRSDKTVTSTKVGRNEPCPCGSGKKSKKCCK